MQTISPKNWGDFQHYKDRKPAWIKLHRDLLDNFEYHCLPTASKALAPLLWLLASEYKDGKIPADYELLAFRFRMTPKDVKEAVSHLIGKGFFVASGMLADCKQSACLETEEETETEEERETEALASSAAHVVFAHWQQVMGKDKARLDAKRKRAITGRLKDGYTVDQLCRAVDGCSLSGWHMGKNDRNIKYNDIELICRDASKVDQFMGMAERPPETDAERRERELDEWVNEGRTIEGECSRVGN